MKYTRRTCCLHCLQTDHVRTNSNRCPKNPKFTKTKQSDGSVNKKYTRRTCCLHCLQTDHVRINSNRCPKNPKFTTTTKKSLVATIQTDGLANHTSNKLS
jgi:hypothetical protein